MTSETATTPARLENYNATNLLPPWWCPALALTDERRRLNDDAPTQRVALARLRPAASPPMGSHHDWRSRMYAG